MQKEKGNTQNRCNKEENNDGNEALKENLRELKPVLNMSCFSRENRIGYFPGESNARKGGTSRSA